MTTKKSKEVTFTKTKFQISNFIRPLCVKLRQMTGYAKKIELNSTMSFKISDKQLLKKYNQIWKKVAKLLKIEFNS